MADAAAVNIIPFTPAKHRRSLRLVSPGDELVNNTDLEIRVTERGGSLIELLRPGHVFKSDVPVEVYFDADSRLNFRSYINQETPDAFAY